MIINPITIRIRRDSAANWASANPVLALGEPGLETDTNMLKYGDGSSDWNTLSYFGPSTTEYTEDEPADADPKGHMNLAVRADSLTSVTDTDGDNIALRSTNKGELYVKHVDAIPITDNGGSLTVDNTNLNAPLSTLLKPADTLAAITSIVNTVKTGGDVAHDSVNSGSPVLQGYEAIAHGTNPTAVSVADRTKGYANRAGIPFVIGGHPNIISSEYITTTSQTDDNILPAISPGTIYVITFIAVIASADNTVSTSVRIGFGTSSVPAQGSSGADAVSGVVVSHPNIPPGSGVTKGNGGGIIGIGGDGAELRITNSTPTGGSIIVQVDYYTISS